ncbi:MAG: hypothetical protein AAF705_18070, partial [Bacteroidota bacterium]
MVRQQEIPVIRKDENLPPAGDYAYLLKEGMKAVESYSGELWTNYNDSDPGVTILQNLCYALTELSYQTSMPIEDLLTREDGKIQYKDRLIPAEQILPVNPVTIEDFSKLVLDQAIEIKQVYIKPTEGFGL